MKFISKKISSNLSNDCLTNFVPDRIGFVWMKLVAIGLLILTLVLSGYFFVYREIYQPYQWRNEVVKALKWIEHIDIDAANALENLPEIERLERLVTTLPYSPKSVAYKDRSAATIAAFELADHLGSPAARYIYGEHLMSGALTPQNDLTAEFQFALAHKNLSNKVIDGNPRATLYYGLILNAGLGVKADPTMSIAVFNRVLGELGKSDLDFLLSRLLRFSEFGFSVPKNNEYFLEIVAEALIKKGGDLPSWEVRQICEHNSLSELIRRCERKLTTASIKNEDQGVSFVAAERSPAVAPAPPSSVKLLNKPAASDKESQNFTGYVKGSKLAAQEGLSTFTVDNRKGGADAVARLYLNGSKPAVRSIYVRSNDTFKAETLSPGNYVLRYRFIGSDDTYEADRLIVLKQTATESGTQFSNVTVTLFREVGGNLGTKKVSADLF